MTYTNRTLTLARKKSINSCALKFAVYLDKSPVGIIGNGETMEISMDSQSHTLKLVPSVPLVKAPRPVEIHAGGADCKANLSIRPSMGLTSHWQLELEYLQRSRDESKQLICGMLLLMTSREENRSLVYKMEEFRREGLDLHVIFTVRAEDVLVTPSERREGRAAGESFEISYRDLTAYEDNAPAFRLTSVEQLDLAAEFERLVRVSGAHSGLNVSRFGNMVTVSLEQMKTE